MKKQLQADLALLLVTVGWGASFILTKNALADLPTFNFLAIRFLLAFALSLGLFAHRLKGLNRKTLVSSFIVGTVLFSGYALQTIGLNFTTTSKSAFITGFSVVLVPLITALFLKKRPEAPAVAGSVMALVGLGLLTLDGNLSVNAGDTLTLIATIAFAMHIISVGHFTAGCDSLMLGVFQIGVVGFWSLLTSLVVETPIVPSMGPVWINILLLSIFCTAGAFIVQSIAQQYTTATHTALIYSGEPVFAAIFGYFMIGDVLSGQGFIGAALILGGMLAAELDVKAILRKKVSAENGEGSAER